MSSSTAPNVLFLGASRGCGFFAALKVLHKGGRATFLLRKPDAVASNPEFLALTEDQRARATLVQGDGFSDSDVQRAIDTAGPEMNTMVFSIGGAPSFTLTRGFFLDPPQPTARSIVVLLPLLHKLSRPGLRLVIVSSMGMGDHYYKLPWLLRPLYGYALHVPHLDKEALEYLSLRASKFTTPAPPATDLPETAASIPTDWLQELIIVRPALLTDGAETGKYRKEPHLTGAYTVSRRDVGHFIAEECLKGENKWVGEDGVVLAY